MPTIRPTTFNLSKLLLSAALLPLLGCLSTYSTAATAADTAAAAYELRPGDIVTHTFALGHHGPLTVVCRQPGPVTDSEIRNTVGEIRYIEANGQVTDVMGTYFRCLSDDQRYANLTVRYRCEHPRFFSRLKDDLYSSQTLEGKQLLLPEDIVFRDGGKITISEGAVNRIRSKCPANYDVVTDIPRREHRRVIDVMRGQPKI